MMTLSKLQKAKATFLLHKVAVLAGISLATILYMGGATIEQGWGSYFLIAPALLLLAIIALARVNDIGPNRKAPIWQVRRVGLATVGVAAVAMMYAPFSRTPVFPAWEMVAITWGFALSWFSTPGLPPFWKYVSGEAKLPKAMT